MFYTVELWITLVRMRDLGQECFPRAEENLWWSPNMGVPLPVALPLHNHQSRRDIASGEVTPPSGDLQEFLARHKPVESEILGSEVLQEMRDEEQWCSMATRQRS